MLRSVSAIGVTVKPSGTSMSLFYVGRSEVQTRKAASASTMSSQRYGAAPERRVHSQGLTPWTSCYDLERVLMLWTRDHLGSRIAQA